MHSPTPSTNSDESQQLVIDDEPPVEIDSDGTEEYFDMLTNGGQKTVPKTEEKSVTLPSVPPKEMTPQRSVIPVAVVAPTNKKRVAHTHSFKLKNLLEEESHELCISAQRSQFYNMRIFLMPHSILGAEFAQQNEVPNETTALSLGQFLNWPDVRLTINFRDLALTRTVQGNWEHELVFGDDPFIKISTKTNVMDKRVCSRIASPKTNPKAHTPILLTYFSAIIDAAAMMKMSNARQNEIEQIYGKFKKDLEDVEVVETKREHSQFLTPYKYMRTFDNDVHYDKAKSHGPKVQLREIINPEVVFSVDKSKFDIDRVGSWENDLMQYLDNLFNKQDRIHLDAFADMLKKCIIVTCTICDKTFEGLLCIIMIKNHLWEHYNKTKWTCVGCHKAFSQFDLTGPNNWSHDCVPLSNGASSPNVP